VKNGEIILLKKKNRENTTVLHCLSFDNFDFTKKFTIKFWVISKHCDDVGRKKHTVGKLSKNGTFLTFSNIVQ